MFYWQVKEALADLRRTKKAIITLGCSFVEGQGAVDQDLYESMEWNMDRLGKPMTPQIDKKGRARLLLKYKNMLSVNPDKTIDWSRMHFNNAFGNILARLYYKSEYTCINFGMAGRGNRATIKCLSLYTQFDWESLDEIIVIYMPSGPERFDFISDNFDGHGMFQTMWPHPDDCQSGPRKTLWKGYAEALYSDKFVILEQLSNVIELQTWCKLHNAKLVITPAFEGHMYTVDNFKSALHKQIWRTMECEIKDIGELQDRDQIAHTDGLIRKWPWDKMFYPDGQKSFAQMCLAKEGINPNTGMWEFQNKGTPNNWFTKCCHPSAKAHQYFAARLFEHLEKDK